jgi:hypothetical protein
MPIYDILGTDETCDRMYAPLHKDPDATSDRFYDKPSIEETIYDDRDRQLQIVELEIEPVTRKDGAVIRKSILDQLGEFPY